MEINEAKGIITQKYLEHRTIDAVIQTFHELTGNPVLVVDKQFSCLAYAPKEPVNDEEWTEITTTGFAGTQFLKQVEDSISFYTRKNYHTPQITITAKKGGGYSRRMVKDISRDGNHLGGVEILEYAKELSSFEEQLLPFVCDLLFLELERSSQPALYHTSRQESALEKLFSASSEDVDLSIFPENENYVIGLMKLPDSKLYTSASLKNEEIMKDCYLISTDGLLLIVLHGENMQIRTARTRIREMVKHFSRSIIYSPLFHDLQILRMYYTEFETVREYLNHSQQAYAVTFISMFVQNQLQKMTESSQLLLRMTNPFAALKNYDDLHDSSLLHTLEVYLSCFCDLNKASEELFIHRNTLNYRIRRICQITGLELEDNEEILSTLMMLRLYMNRTQQ